MDLGQVRKNLEPVAPSAPRNHFRAGSKTSVREFRAGQKDLEKAQKPYQKIHRKIKAKAYKQ